MSWNSWEVHLSWIYPVILQPLMPETCCCAYTIRLDVTTFQPSKSQRKLLRTLDNLLRGQSQKQCRLFQYQCQGYPAALSLPTWCIIMLLSQGPLAVLWQIPTKHAMIISLNFKKLSQSRFKLLWRPVSMRVHCPMWVNENELCHLEYGACIWDACIH